MAAYRRVYDSRHLGLTAKNRDQLRNPTLGNRVWATFFTYANSVIRKFLARAFKKKKYCQDAVIIRYDAFAVRDHWVGTTTAGEIFPSRRQSLPWHYRSHAVRRIRRSAELAMVITERYR